MSDDKKIEQGQPVAARHATQTSSGEQISPLFDATKGEAPPEQYQKDGHRKQYFARILAWQRDPFRQKLRLSDWAIVFLAACIAILAYMQWKEMESGGRDTKTIADAARKVKNASERSADASKQFADTADGIERDLSEAVARLNTQAAETQTLASQAVIQSQTAQKSVGIAAQQLDSSERPWMKVNIGLYPPDAKTGPVTFDDQGGVRLGVLIDAQNVGKSPATNVKVEAKLIPALPMFSPPSQREEWEKKQRDMCDETRSPVDSRITGNGDTVFPEEPYRPILFLYMTPGTVESELIKPSNNSFSIKLADGRDQPIIMSSVDMFQPSQAFGFTPNPGLAIIGCLEYEIEYSGARHQTAFLFDLAGIDLRSHSAGDVTVGRKYGWGDGAN